MMNVSLAGSLTCDVIACNLSLSLSFPYHDFSCFAYLKKTAKIKPLQQGAQKCDSFN